MDSHELDSTHVPPDWSEHLVALRRLAAGLQRDEHAREDVVQETLLGALLRPPRALSWRWLAATLRHRSIDRARRAERRERHEVCGQVPPAAPSADVIAQKLELQRELHDAVRALREPYRQVVYLRFVEERTPSEIAATLGVPVKTVKTQLARGLALLRERLERRYGRDLRGLAFLFSSSAAAVVGSAGFLLMVKKAAVAIAVVLGLLGLWYTLTSSPTPSSEAADVAGARVAGVAREPRLPTERAPTEEERRVAAAASVRVAPDAPATGSLRVHVLWSDGAPASGIGVRLLDAESRRPVGDATNGSSGPDGIALFEHIWSERCLVRADRGAEVGPVATAVLAAGEVVDVELRLGRGISVEGRVLDAHGASVADAEIWIVSGQRDWLSLECVARADVAGRFEVRDAPRKLSLCATAPLLGPSAPFDLELLTGDSPLRVDLTLGASGGDLVGRVVQASGAPVPYAWVALDGVGRGARFRFDGTFEEQVGPRATACDVDGRFRIDGVEPGRRLLTACARGFALTTSVVQVEAGRASDVVIELSRGAELTGTVRDEAGAPVAGAFVRAFANALSPRYLGLGQYDDTNAFGSPVTRSDAEGRYRLGPVWSDEVHAYASPPPDDEASHSRQEFHAEAVLHPHAGEVSVWNPVLSPGPSIRGRVTFADGSPMREVFVTATPGDIAATRTAHTNDAGEFAFHNLELQAFRIDVEFFGSGGEHPPLFRDDVWPDQGALELRAESENPERAPKGAVRGKVVDADGAASQDTGIGLMARNDTTYFGDAYEHGAFRFEGVPADQYRVVVFHGEDTVLVGEPFELAAGETHDVGTLRLGRRAALRVRLDRAGVGADAEPLVYFQRTGCALGRLVQPEKRAELTFDDLTVGSYSLNWWGSGLAQGERTVDLERENDVVIELKVGWSRAFDVVFPVGRAGSELELVVTAPDGASVYRTRIVSDWNETSPFRLARMLPAGSFRVTASTDSGLSAVQDLVIRTDEANPTATRLELK